MDTPYPSSVIPLAKGRALLYLVERKYTAYMYVAKETNI